jgi:creatinine amidohydrolase
LQDYSTAGADFSRPYVKLLVGFDRIEVGVGKENCTVELASGSRRLVDRYQPPLLEQLTWVETRDLLALQPVGLLPVGAIEAHGPHLPLDTDVVIAQGMARSGAAYLHSAGIPSVILPAVSYSVSFAGACFAGTSPVSGDTFQSYVTEILSHHASLGYRAICVCNAHLEPAHIAALGQAVSVAANAGSIPIVFPDQRLEPWANQLGEEFNRGSRHAGSYETSILMVEAAAKGLTGELVTRLRG